MKSQPIYSCHEHIGALSSVSSGKKKKKKSRLYTHRWSITKKEVLSVSSSPGGSVGWVDREEGAPPVGESGFFFLLLFFHSLTIRFLPFFQSRRCPLAERSRCTAKRKTSSSSASPTTGFWLASNKFRWKTFDGCRDPMAHRITKRKKLQRWPSTGLCWRFFFFVYLFTAMQERRDQVEHVLGLGHPEWHA